MENNLLWQLEETFKNNLERAIHDIKYNGTTIKELLDLGFNNNYLMLGNKEFELGYKNEKGEYSYELTQEQLNIKVKMQNDDYCYNESDEDGYFIDLNGYHISRVVCVNKEDEKLFVEED